MTGFQQLRIGHYILLPGLIWTLLIGLLIAWNIKEEHQNSRKLAILQARAYFNKDQALRLWATQHGRIYVPVTERYRPDPAMAHIPERDITTPSGLKLTLLNPARIIRQLDEDFSYLYGVTGKITSLAPLAEANLPDDWERSALQRLYQGQQEVMEFTGSGDDEALRLMQPLIVNQGCLMCHFDQSFEIGKPGGGIGIKLPMKEIRAQSRTRLKNKIYTLVGIWLAGLLGLLYGNLLFNRQEKGRQEALRQLQHSERRKSAIMETALDCIISIDTQDRIIEFNPAAEKTFGYTRQQVLGQKLSALLIPESLRRQHEQALNRHLQTGKSSILGTRIETRALHADGHEFPIELAIARIDLDNETLFTAYLRDITAQKKLEKALRHQAIHDELTGLINRQNFEKRLQQASNSLSNNRAHCLCYIDLDRFKIINDSCGHKAGDELLRQLAALMSDTVGDNAVLGRLGGDEFGLLIHNCGHEKATHIARKLLQEINRFRFYWDDKIFSLSLSIGIIFITNTQQNVSELLSQADAACYRAKEEGRNRFFIDGGENATALQQRLGEIDWINRIQSAFEDDRVVLYQQPIFDIQSDPTPRCHAIEILFRLIDEDGKLVAPERFMPAAERYNLMPVIDRWVIRHTCRWLVAQKGELPLVAINLSGDSIADPLFLEFVTDQLQSHDIEARKICLEITETVAITNLSKARVFISSLHDFGCYFALDDFGSGMSSYGYLKDLPVDHLKIDGQFVRNADQDPINLAMVKSINEVGQLMGKKTIAEFIENQAVLDLMIELGVDYAQGFYLGKPEPLEHFKGQAS